MTDQIKLISRDPIMMSILTGIVAWMAWLTLQIHDHAMWRAETNGNRFKHSDYVAAVQAINDRIHTVERTVTMQLTEYIRVHQHPTDLPPEWFRNEVNEIKLRVKNLENP